MIFVKPSTTAILGSTPSAPTAQPLQEQEEPRPHQSFWGRLKQKAQRALGGLKDAVVFIKESVVPIIVAVSSLVGVLRYQKPRQSTGRCYLCYA